MTRFQLDGTAVEAHPWNKNGDHPNDYLQTHHGLEGGELREFTGEERKAKGWEGDVVRYYRHPDYPDEALCAHCGVKFHSHGFIDGPGVTDSTPGIVCPGDWIITDQKTGLHYAVKPDLFTAVFEKTG